jgi:hypothetical protein
MRKLTEVEDAKKLMTAAMDWSVLRWLWEKPRVREAADKANAALDRLNHKVKLRWREEVKAVCTESRVRTASPSKKCRKEAAHAQETHEIDPEVRLFSQKVQQADERAHSARMDAEKTFDDAERLLSTSLAREGCQKAILFWNLHEKAIRLAEAGMNSDRGRT